MKPMRLIGLGYLLTSSLTAYGQMGAVNSLAMWSRKLGNYSDIENPDKGNLKTLDVTHFKLQKRTMHDAQYERDVTFKGIPLTQILSSYATPLPIYEQRSPEHLLNHVKYPKVLAKKKGIMMPTQDDVTLSEMQALWQWMKVGAKRKTLPPYQP